MFTVVEGGAITGLVIITIIAIIAAKKLIEMTYVTIPKLKKELEGASMREKVQIEEKIISYRKDAYCCKFVFTAMIMPLIAVMLYMENFWLMITLIALSYWAVHIK